MRRSIMFFLCFILTEFDFLSKFNVPKLKKESSYGEYGTAYTITKKQILKDEKNWYDFYDILNSR
jgi:hypothetical protein